MDWISQTYVVLVLTLGALLAAMPQTHNPHLAQPLAMPGPAIVLPADATPCATLAKPLACTGAPRNADRRLPPL